MVWTCEEEGRIACGKKNGRSTGSRKRDAEAERKPGGKTCVVEMRKVWAEGGICNGQDNVEERNPKLFRRPQMMGKS